MKQKTGRSRYYRHAVINGLGGLCGRFCGKPLESLESRRVVVIAPHPDDEALGCGGLLSHLAANDRISLIVLTGGEHCYSAEVLPHQEQKRIRQELVRQANRHIGLPTTSIHLLNFTDGQISAADPEQASLRVLLEQLQPEVVFVPYVGDTSVDHLQAHLMIKELIQNKSVRLYGYGVWFWHNTSLCGMLRAPWHTARYFPLDEPTRTAKAEMINIYESAQSATGLRYSGRLSPEMIAAQLGCCEIYFETKI